MYCDLLNDQNTPRVAKYFFQIILGYVINCIYDGKSFYSQILLDKVQLFWYEHNLIDCFLTWIIISNFLSE